MKAAALLEPVLTYSGELGALDDPETTEYMKVAKILVIALHNVGVEHEHKKDVCYSIPHSSSLLFQFDASDTMSDFTLFILFLH